MDSSTQLASVFTLQFYYYFGKLEGFRIVDEKTSGAKELIAQERKLVIIRIKTLWEAFGKVVRKELAMEPEALLLVCFAEDPENDHQLKVLDQLKDEMAKVEVDPSRLVQQEKRYLAILTGVERPHLRLV